MIAINHALTGALIGAAVGDPLIAVPLAFASHFALDSLPHFSIATSLGGMDSKLFRMWLICDALLCGLLVAILWRWHGAHWLTACLCGLVAAAPDFMWAKKFIAAQAGKFASQPTYLLARIHKKIQWFERPSGLAMEFGWALICSVILSGFLIVR